MAGFIPASIGYAIRSVETSNAIDDGLIKLLPVLAPLIIPLKPVLTLVATVFGLLIGFVSQSYVYQPLIDHAKTNTLKDLLITFMLALGPIFYLIKICLLLGPLGLVLFPILLPIFVLLTFLFEGLLLPVSFLLGIVTDLISNI